MLSRPLYVILLTALALILTACVETETKRTTKKVDASKVEFYQVDMNKPRLRLALNIPDFIEVNIQNMLTVEVDDGQRRYAFGRNVFVPDTTQPAGLLYSPWVNTPDSGSIVLAFRLAYETGANIVDDRMTVRVRPGHIWRIEFGIQRQDPCPQWPDLELCRTYALPRDVESSGDGQFYLAWGGEPLVITDR